MSNNNYSGPSQSRSGSGSDKSEIVTPAVDTQKRADAAAEGRRGAVSGPASNAGTAERRDDAAVSASSGDTTDHQDDDTVVVSAYNGCIQGRRDAIAGVLDGNRGSLNQDSPDGKQQVALLSSLAGSLVSDSSGQLSLG